MKGTKEFYELMDQFERDCRSSESSMFTGDLKRCKDENLPAGIFYENGHTNQLFHAYMCGYQYSKLLNRD